VGAHPLEVLLTSGGVDADEQAARGEAVDDDVVDDPAALVAERGVLRLAVLALRQIVGDQPLRGLQRAGAFEDDLAHVADVEDAGALAHGEVLLDQALVLHGHVEPGKLDHPGTRGQVCFVEGSALGHGPASGGGPNLAGRQRRRKASLRRGPIVRRG